MLYAYWVYTISVLQTFWGPYNIYLFSWTKYNEFVTRKFKRTIELLKFLTTNQKKFLEFFFSVLCAGKESSTAVVDVEAEIRDAEWFLAAIQLLVCLEFDDLSISVHLLIFIWAHAAHIYHWRMFNNATMLNFCQGLCQLLSLSPTSLWYQSLIQ